MKWLDQHQGLIFVALVILGLIATPMMRYWLCWDVSVVASVWVAVGTLALAGVTWWNVSQTIAVVAGEDRRHQQSFVPIVELKWFNASDTALGYLQIHARNIGKGPALNIQATIKGFMVLRPGTPGESVGDDLTYVLDKLVFETSACAPDTSSDGIVSLVSTDFSLTKYSNVTIVPDTIAVTSAEVLYTDLFGNVYKTVYDDFRAKKYHLEQPDHLKIPTTIRIR
jgi:hypothetical protein